MLFTDSIQEIRRFIDVQEFQIAVEALDYILRDLGTYPIEQRQEVLQILVREFESIVSSGYSKVDESLSHIGNTFLDHGHPNEAEIFYQHSLNKKRGNIFSTTGIGRCCSCRHEFAQALRWYRKSLKIDPHDRFVKVKVVEAYISLERYEEAKEILFELMKDNPLGNYCVERRLADAYIGQQKYEDAIEILLTIDQKKDQRFDLTLFGLAMCFARLKMREEFLLVYSRFMKYSITNAKHYNEMTDCCYLIGLYEEAYHCAFLAVKTEPENNRSWYLLANISRKLKKYEQAIRACNLLLARQLEIEHRQRALTCKGYSYVELYRANPEDNHLYVSAKKNLEAACDGYYGWAAAGMVFLYAAKYEHHPEYRMEMMRQMEKYMVLGELWYPDSKDVVNATNLCRRLRRAFDLEFGRYVDYSIPNEEEPVKNGFEDLVKAL